MNICDAIQDENLFRPYLADRDNHISTWVPWLIALKALYGLPIPKKRYDLVRQCTGRDPEKLPKDGFRKALFLTGRRSGKSRMAAVVCAFEAVLAGREERLAPGERGIVPVISPTKKQSGIVKDYLREIFKAPMLQSEVVAETRNGFELRSGTRIDVLSSAHQAARGFSFLACCVDEICFMGVLDADKAYAKSDTELVRAIFPSLLTTGGRMIGISSPYWRKGYAWQQYQRCFGNDAGRTLVWNCPSRTMNETLSQQEIDDAIAEDPQANRAEYLGEFRDDVGEFLSRAVIENLVVLDRIELMPQDRLNYLAFADLSGGRGDDAALAIAHRAERKVVVDLARRWKAPFNPYEVIGDMSRVAKTYGCRRIMGDNYAAEFCGRAFQAQGMRYERSEKNKSQLYAELLPRMTSGEIELLDNDVLINQLAGLERRTRAGGKDIIDHPPGGRDDLANAVAGVSVLAARPKVTVGGINLQPNMRRILTTE